MRNRWLLSFLFLFLFAHSAAAFAQQQVQSGSPGPEEDGHHHHPPQSEPAPGVGVDEKLGQTIPLDITFRDEQNQPVSLKALFTKPVILSLVYYTCPSVCPRIMSGTAQVLARMGADSRGDYSVLTVSFDETDKPVVAAQRKKNYLKAINQPFPEEDWRFLTGDAESIRRLTEAVGFQFQRRGDAFEHPSLLIVLSPQGKITRYLYGVTYLPFDVKMALAEASEGRVGPTISRVLLFCFSYDPEGRTYVFNILKVTGLVTLILAGSFLGVLLLKRKSDSTSPS